MNALEMLRDVADMVICVELPASFEGVGQFYQDFSEVTDQEVKEIMLKHGYKSHHTVAE